MELVGEVRHGRKDIGTHTVMKPTDGRNRLFRGGQSRARGTSHSVKPSNTEQQQRDRAAGEEKLPLMKPADTNLYGLKWEKDSVRRVGDLG